MPSLLAKIEMLERLIPPPEVPSEFDAYDPAARQAIASFALAAAESAGIGRPNPSYEAVPEVAAAALAAAEAMRRRLAKEGLLFGPLDEVQHARLRAIGEAMRTLPDPVAGAGNSHNKG